MDGNFSDVEDDIDWNTDDELEIANYHVPSSSTLSFPGEQATAGFGEASCVTGPSSSSSSSKSMIHDFLKMGFKEKVITKAMEENGDADPESMLNTLLTYQAIEDSPEEQELIDLDLPDKQKTVYSDYCSSDYGGLTNEVSYIDIGSEDEISPYLSSKRRKCHNEMFKRKRPMGLETNILSKDDEILHLPNPMIGFGVPGKLCSRVNRKIPEAAIGPPYFYYENVAFAPKGVWQKISRFLYDIEPEFVDSIHFCAAARKRGYVHNLPITNRFPLVPIPHLTIQDALPMTKKWWATWDPRTKLNCIQTGIGSATLTQRIRKALEECDGEPPKHVKKYVLDECRRWNLVWVGRNKVAPLEPDEIEMLLGFPKNHTRGGASRTVRYKSLGNSFQVDTVAYHLSVLKKLYPRGINLLSLFSGIGGAEVALHKLGIPLNNVVSVEICEENRNIVRSWWEQTNQKGNLIDIADVQTLNAGWLEELMDSFSGFDLVVGGSPCNNLAGSNSVSRDGLEGEHSALFFHYVRILDIVKFAMSSRRR